MSRTIIGSVFALLVATNAFAQDAEQAIRGRVQQFIDAFNAGDGQAIAAIYAEDAQILPPDGEAMEGRDAIGQFWQGAIDAGMTDLQLTPVEIHAEGEIAYEVGEFDLTMPTSGGGTASITGKYLVVWKQADGDWWIHRDIWNDNAAEQ